MTLPILQARWLLNEVRPEEVPQMAVRILETGVETPAVIELAGLISPDRWEVNRLLDDAFQQAELLRPSLEAARWRLAYYTARQIVAGQVTPLGGASTLWSLATDLELPESLRYFVYLAADYGEGPEDPATERAWFDAKIIETAEALLREERPDQAPSRQAGV